MCTVWYTRGKFPFFPTKDYSEKSVRWLRFQVSFQEGPRSTVFLKLIIGIVHTLGRELPVEFGGRTHTLDANGSLPCGWPIAFKARSIAELPNVTLLKMSTAFGHPQPFVSFYPLTILFS